MKFGDWVEYQIRGYGDRSGRGIVVGEMRYSKPDSIVILLADEEKLGMPIAAKWCRTTAAPDLLSAMRYRQRYDQRFPGHLKPLKYKTKATDSNVSP